MPNLSTENKVQASQLSNKSKGK